MVGHEDRVRTDGGGDERRNHQRAAPALHPDEVAAADAELLGQARVERPTGPLAELAPEAGGVR